MPLRLRGCFFLFPVLTFLLAIGGALPACSLAHEAGAPAEISATTPAAQTISPKSIIVHLGLAQQFTSAGATKWSTSAGAISSSGSFAAPVTMPKSNLVTISATGPGGTAKAVVTLVAGAEPSIAPNLVNLALGKTVQFTSPEAVSWTAQLGTITAKGLYTAPKTWTGTGEDYISSYGSRGTASARIFLIPPVPTITGISPGKQVPQGVFTLAISGTNLTSESVILLDGVALHTVLSGGLLHATGFIGEPGTATVAIANGTLVSPKITITVGVPNAKVSSAAARRFLEQAAFGPSPADIQTVQTLGFPYWLSQQMTAPTCATYSQIKTVYGGMPQKFITNAVNCPDQLRQRVAFALSQIFVTSLDKLGSNVNMITYQDMLLADAFTNYRKIMGDVTLSPAMGEYLDMVNNAKADPTTGSAANENYARELMQLFTIGTSMLNPDGTVQYDSNNIPIPTYSQFTVTEFARVYTGWTYSTDLGSISTTKWNIGPTPYSPMSANVTEHDTGSKQLLNGYVAPAGVSPMQDIDNALDNIFAHPNVGPFVCTQLIQHLVESNPSPAYVKRVAAVFDDNGSKVRGDMAAVIKAILLDPEARAGDSGSSESATAGHLQEPALFVAGMVRAFGGTMTDENYYYWNLANLGQDIFSPESVFNYYAPNTGVQGTNLMGGEFQIYTPDAAVMRANLVTSLFSAWASPVQTYGPGTTVDLTSYETLANNPAQLVAALDLTLTHGTMPASMKSTIITAVAGETGGDLRRVQRGIYLILTSGFYNVWH
jgi:uncharacterized protein (DUF1800 family)